ncbi:uracil-DNA glycosylase [Gallicola sp. Sow4_E12]|uniref:uracil-DNA glycosylase n=1 Tax=Gallicola sp. Sow4_E12 TaxID=3438785 RepID=UPI003F926B43
MVEIGNQWDELLREEWNKEYYRKLRKNLIEEYRHNTVFPDKELLFESLKRVDYEDVKVVILGQDPYHGKGQAHGFSFSVLPGTRIPPSLRNVYKELHEDLGCSIPNNGYLMKWAEQGVLLLNTSLTVREGQANSHKDLGWHILTDRIIELLGSREKEMVFILWGRNAINKIPLIKNKNHLILKSVHPSPLSAHRGFFGSRPFSKTNQFLIRHKEEPIDWQIENI